MSATRGDVRHPNVDGVGILLPSSWRTIDLRDSASRRRSVAKLVEQQGGDSEMPTAEEFAEELRRPARRRGVKVLDRTVERVDLPVGPAVVETEITASRMSRRVVCGVAWTVFPNGYLDTVQMHFRTSFPDVLDALRGESELMVGSLQIEPDEAP